MTRVLFSALSARRGGGLTYIRNVVREFPREGGHRLTILSSQPVEGLPDHPNVEWARAPSWTLRPIPRIVLGRVYFRYLWPRRRDFDLAYYAGGTIDVALGKGVKKVVAFRNMLPFDKLARQQFPWGWNRARHWLLEYVQASAFRQADLVIFISKYAREVIDRRVPHRRGSSVVIPHGASETTARLDPAVAAKLPSSFVLYLSILAPYKAQLETVQAWAELRKRRDTPEKLVLAGPTTDKYADRVREEIRRLGLVSEVVLTGPVMHDQVTDLARRASLNLFLSTCENCPNILLELMHAGSPLLVSNRQPMPELGGPGLDYVDPHNPVAIADGIRRLLDDPARGAFVTAAARARSSFFTWNRAGRVTWEAILKCANRLPENVETTILNECSTHV